MVEKQKATCPATFRQKWFPALSSQGSSFTTLSRGLVIFVYICLFVYTSVFDKLYKGGDLLNCYCIQE